MIENTPKISVIIPVYNGEKYIVQCLENMLCQTYKNLEVIVVNDGSTDKSSEIARKFPVKVIDQKNGGVSVARNAGIDCATGDFIHFMDVDDLICLDYYEKMMAASLATNADMVCCEVIHERLPGLSLRFCEKLLVSIIEDKMLLTNVRNQGACYKYLFRTDFLKTTGLKFDKHFRNAQDLVFSFQAVYYANKIATVPQAVYFYKNREQSAMTTMTKAHRHRRRECVKNANSFCEEFAIRHNLKITGSLKKVQYKLLGIPLFKKQTFNTGKERWYLFGIYVFQRK